MAGEESIREVITRKDAVDDAGRVWQLSSLEVCEDIAHSLNGDVYDYTKKTWTVNKDMAKRLVNDNGMQFIRTIINSKINKNNLLSYYDPETISFLMMDFEKSLIDKISIDWEKMGINKSDASAVVFLVCDNVLSALNRARYGGEKQFIENTEERRILETPGKSPKLSSSIFSRLPGGEN